MNTLDLGIIYAALGLGLAAHHTLRTRGGARAVRLTEAILIIPFWPLLCPVLWLGSDEIEPDRGFVGALRAIQGTPLAELLPDAGEVRLLASRLSEAKQKVVEIDHLLTQPAFDRDAAERRHAELIERGDTQAASAVAARQQGIARLETLRDRFSRELEQVEELMVQLHVQAEVVRLAGDVDESVQEVFCELLSRVEGLDEVLFGFVDSESAMR